MANIINLETFKDDRGSLSVIEKILPFEIKRIYFIYNVCGVRGGHGHLRTIQGLISVHGSCEIIVKGAKKEERFALDSPDKCLLLQPEDWHQMQNFTNDCVLLVIASEYFDSEDYIPKVVS